MNEFWQKMYSHREWGKYNNICNVSFWVTLKQTLERRGVKTVLQDLLHLPKNEYKKHMGTINKSLMACDQTFFFSLNTRIFISQEKIATDTRTGHFYHLAHTIKGNSSGTDRCSMMLLCQETFAGSFLITTRLRNNDSQYQELTNRLHE